MASAALPAPPPSPPHLVRAIGRYDLTAAVVNGVIGSAIFTMPSSQAALTGAWSPLAALAAGLGALTIVLCFAEVSSRFREAGGPYLYARAAFGPAVGFQAGWLTFWIRVTALAANLNVFVEYAAVLVPALGESWGRAITMAVVVVVVTAINLVGVKQAAWTVNLFTLAKVAPLLALAIIGLPAVRASVLATQTVAEPHWTRAILLLMFAYGGFEAPLLAAGEARDPRRDSAFALVAALLVVAGVYLLVQLVVVGVVPHVAGTKAPIAAAFAVLLGPVGTTVAAAAAMASIYGYATGNTLQSPRVLFSMAEAGELPSVLARIHPRSNTPHVAILAYSTATLALAWTGTFESTATLSAIVRLITYGITCAALLILRRKKPQEAPGFRLAGAQVIAPVAVIFCLWLLLSRSFAQAWAVMLIMALGELVGFGRASGRMAPPEG
jgi:basic amino acid/polyamine antiporter, APA family